MKRIITISFIALLAISFSGFAQEITTSSQSEVSTFQIDGVQAVLYDQTTTVSTETIASQQFGPANATYNCQGADDFVVPAGEVWTIDSLLVPGTSSGLFALSNIFFYADEPDTIPGTLVAADTMAIVSDASGLLSITLSTPVVLPEGTYWVSVQPQGEFAVTGQWFWYLHTSANGNIWSWQNPGGGFGTNATSWLPHNDVTGIGPYVDNDLSFLLYGTSAPAGGSGLFPEVLYYTFDETGTDSTYNFAVPGSGLEWAKVLGGLTMGPTGQFGSALITAGNPGTTDYVNTGWVTDIGASSWTISLWLNNITTDFGYVFGDNTASSWRCFLNGVAGSGNIIIRGGGMSDLIVAGAVPGPSVVTFVYDTAAGEAYGYLNGVLVNTVVQPALNIVGTGPFKVGGYSSSGGIAAGSLIDEYRLYNRALDSAEVAATWNITIVPVELTSFTASVNDNDVTLNWITASEINNSGFQVERKSNDEYEAIGFIPGFGTTTEPKAYSFSDVNLNPGTYSYRLKQIDYDGTFEYSDPVEVDIVIPDVYSLQQNYPNPFNPSTKITFTLAANANVTLRIFDVLGQEVMTLINQDLTAGVHTYEFDAAGFNSGVYFYRIEANGNDGTNFTNVKKMILLK